MSANADSDDEKWKEKNQNQDAMKLYLINEALILTFEISIII